jgi:hypothetical protein
MLEGTLIAPDTPRDAGEAVGECDGRDVVPRAELHTECPELEWAGLVSAVRGEERGTRAVDQEHAEVGVASLGDATEATPETGG